jgi:hypothetical protein
MTVKGKKSSKKTVNPQWHSVHNKYHMDRPIVGLLSRTEMPACKHLSYGTAH